jgi:hypothetical protein
VANPYGPAIEWRSRVAHELNTIGKRIAHRLILPGMNKTQFAHKTCRLRQVVSAWITDKKVPSTQALRSIRAALECGYEFLLDVASQDASIE